MRRLKLLNPDIDRFLSVLALDRGHVVRFYTDVFISIFRCHDELERRGPDVSDFRVVMTEDWWCD
jgi:hypothetical protein